MLSIAPSILIIVMYSIVNRHNFNVFLTMMVGFYVFVLVGSCLCIELRVYPWPVNPINPIIFTLLFILCINPFKRVSVNLSKIINCNEKLLNRFAVIYILVFLIYMLIFVPKCIETISSGSYLITYQDMRNGTIERFSDLWEKWLYYFVSRLQYPAMLVGFVYLCKGKIWRGIIMMIAAFSAVSIYAVYIVSRTVFFQIFLLISSLFIVFRSQLSKRIKTGCFIILTIMVIVITIFSVDITASRTEYVSNDLWIFNYFGRSILTYNSIVDNTCIAKDGIYFFGTQSFFTINHPSYSGHEFVPLFARMYMDFNLFGYLFIALIPLFLPRQISDIPKFYAMLWIFNTLILGVMYSNFTITEIVFAIIVYYTLKLMFKKSSVVHRVGNDIKTFRN